MPDIAAAPNLWPQRYAQNVDTSVAPYYVNEAGEAHIGQVGGEVVSVSASPTVQAAAYSAGNVLGGKLTFSSIARIADKSLTIQAAMLFSKAAQTGIPVDLLLFNADPSASTFTDKAALAVAVADYDKLIGVVHLYDWVSLGTPSLCQALGIALPALPVSGGRDLYGVLVARAAITPASTSDLKVQLRAWRD